MTTLIKQAYLVGADEAVTSANGTADVLIEAGKIVAIAPTLPDSFTHQDLAELDDIIEAQGQYLGSGLIDLYSQSGEPGFEARETYESIQQAAAAGGFTRVGLLPNTQPAVDSIGAIAAVKKANASSQSQLMPWAAITLEIGRAHV